MSVWWKLKSARPSLTQCLISFLGNPTPLSHNKFTQINIGIWPIPNEQNLFSIFYKALETRTGPCIILEFQLMKLNRMSMLSSMDIINLTPISEGYKKRWEKEWVCMLSWMDKKQALIIARTTCIFEVQSWRFFATFQ